MSPRQILAVCVAVLVPTLAHAQASPLEEAKTQFSLGAQAYSTARYDVAVVAFAEAYRLLPRPEILFSPLAQAEKKQCLATKDGALLKKALVHYRQYNGQVESGGRKSEAVEAIEYLERLATQADFGGGAPAALAQRTPTKLSVYSSVDGAHVYIDGRSQGDVPFVGGVTPGRHRVLVRLDGYVPVERDISIAEGTTQTLPMNLVERAVGVAFDVLPGTDIYIDGAFAGRTPFGVEGRPVAPGGHTVVAAKNGKRLLVKEITVERGKPIVVRLPLETSGQRVAAYVTGGLGVATLVASGVFFGVAFAEQSRAQNRQLMLSNGNLQPQGVEQYNNALANRDSFRAVGTVSALGGALALAGGVALFAFDRPDPNSVPIRSPEGPRNKPKSDFEVAAAPLFSEGTYGLGAIGRF